MSQYRIKKISKYCAIKRQVQDFYSVQYKVLGLFWIDVNWPEWDGGYIYRTEFEARVRIADHKTTKARSVKIIEVE